ncbi:hypothetical protein [Roseovarius sp. 2305UL8-3]
MQSDGRTAEQNDRESVLASALQFGLPSSFTLEWMLDRVEQST